MNNLAKEIITYSAAEQLAKDADFKGDSIAGYLQRAERYYGGDTTAFTAEETHTMRVQELMLLDDEETVVSEHPELSEKFSESDRHQLEAATDSRNLDYYLQHGVNYTFDSTQINAMRDSIDLTKPVSAQLMRERIVSAEGLDNVRMNVVYHDMMDHLWGFEQIRASGLDSKYADYMSEVGNPFTGFLFSKQAELISGIGYNARRFVTDPAHHGALGASKQALSEHLSIADTDERVTSAIDRINQDSELADAAGFVIVGAIGSLLLQRSRAGSVKRINGNSETGLSITAEPVALLDPRYLALMIDSTETILLSGDQYKGLQTELNLTIEALLRNCMQTGSNLGHLALGSQPDLSGIPDNVRVELEDKSAVSTSYYA